MIGINCEGIKLLSAMSVSGKGSTLLWNFIHFLPVRLPPCTTKLPIPYFTVYPPYLPPHYLQGFCFVLFWNLEQQTNIST